MSTIDEITKMQQEGRSEPEIAQILRERGISPNEIINALSQTKIKEAVYGEESSQNSMDEEAQSAEGITGMQPSLLQTVPQEDYAQGQQTYQLPYPEGQQNYQNYEQQEPSYSGYYQQGLSSDTITEISEQVVAEKMSQIKNQLEKALDLKASVESKIEYIDERLKRIEKIIDRLQLSVLQKVGEYVTDVSDLKKEFIETQKSFKTLAHHKHQSS